MPRDLWHLVADAVLCKLRFESTSLLKGHATWRNRFALLASFFSLVCLGTPLLEGCAAWRNQSVYSCINMNLPVSAHHLLKGCTTWQDHLLHSFASVYIHLSVCTPLLKGCPHEAMIFWHQYESVAWAHPYSRATPHGVNLLIFCINLFMCLFGHTPTWRLRRMAKSIQDLMPRHPRESHKIVLQGCARKDLARSWYKKLLRASRKSFHTSAPKTGHLPGLLARTPNTWHLQNLHGRTSSWISPGAPQDLLTRTSERSCPRASCQDISQSSARLSKEGLAIKRILQDLYTRNSYKSTPHELLYQHRAKTWPPQDLHAKTSCKDLTRTPTRSSQGPVQDHASLRKGLAARMSTRPSHTDLYKIMQEPCL